MSRHYTIDITFKTQVTLTMHETLMIFRIRAATNRNDFISISRYSQARLVQFHSCKLRARPAREIWDDILKFLSKTISCYFAFSKETYLIRIFGFSFDQYQLKYQPEPLLHCVEKSNWFVIINIPFFQMTRNAEERNERRAPSPRPPPPSRWTPTQAWPPSRTASSTWWTPRATSPPPPTQSITSTDYDTSSPSDPSAGGMGRG